MFSLGPVIHDLMEHPLDVGEAMQRLIDAHHRERPDGDWEPYRRLPFDDEAVRLSLDWFPAVIADDPPVKVPVRGLFLGLFQPVVERRTVADFYLGGASQFEEDSSSFDWAVNPAYFP